jgi:hypothetical protein
VSSAAASPGELRAEGLFRILTPEEAVAHIASLGPMGNVVLSPLIAGCPPEWGWESLKLFAEKVRPNI